MTTSSDELLAKLNAQQRHAVTHEGGPLLIIAGAGTGKTNTLAHRVAHLIARGVNPGRLLLLTFTRRAAAEMLSRVEGILRGHSAEASLSRLWSGTFHSIANRLLRIYGKPLGLGENFTVLDRSDSEDLLNVVRSELGLDKGEERFPRKGTCAAIYSRVVNAQEPLDCTLKHLFPWCQQHEKALKNLFRSYTQRKQSESILDYDDLLLYWFHMMQEESLAALVRQRFDAVLVDEYQDTNLLQAKVLERLCPEGKGLTVVGDDAQSIYSFRAATVHNILDFPKTFPTAEVVKLEQNYRSVQPILDAANAVIALSPQRHEKQLFSLRRSGQKPVLARLTDEDQQTKFVIERVLQHLEGGIQLRRQAVLFRTLHHSGNLEVELARRSIPFVKYGGLKFLEAAHVKDLLAYLRLAENARDTTSAFRVLQLIDGIGPAVARRALQHLTAAGSRLAAWEEFAAPPAAENQWREFVALMLRIAPGAMPLGEQIAHTRRFYTPILEKRYEQAAMRARDLEQLEQLSSNFRGRSEMLAELTLDPPSSTQDLAGPPLLEEDYLTLSTIHSAKGCEWDAVYVLHAADGNIPSDMSTGSEELIEEERRLFYVALTRAKDFLYVCQPAMYYQKKLSSRYSLAQLTRFLPDSALQHFEQLSLQAKEAPDAPHVSEQMIANIRGKISSMWD